MLSTKLKEAAGNSADATLYVDDVFSTYLYTGTGAAQTITNGIDLAGKGGLVWQKKRNGVANHGLWDTARGIGNFICTNLTNAQGYSEGVNAFNSNGFTLGSVWNSVGEDAVSWTFRKAAKFFDVVTYTGTGSARTIAHSLGVAPGMVIVKRTDTTGNWQVYHSGLTSAAYSIQLNSTVAEASAPTVWNSTAPTSSVFSVGTDATVNASGGTYVAYLYASQAGGFGTNGTDSIIACGSFTSDGSASQVSIDLGWEPQYIIFKRISSTGSDWYTLDTMRGWINNDSSFVDNLLVANAATAENTTSYALGSPYATGAYVRPTNLSSTYIYMAIRMPNKPPTTGTQVYTPVLYTGDGAATKNISTGKTYVTDWMMTMDRTNGPFGTGSGYNSPVITRLTGFGIDPPYLKTISSDAEGSSVVKITLNNSQYDYTVYGTSGNLNTAGLNYVDWNFRRAPGFFDVVCYTGTGSATTQAHNLTVVPEMMIVKERSAANNWWVYVSSVGNTKYSVLNSTAAPVTSSTAWNNTTPTASVFSIGTGANVNASTQTFVAYLFATLAGISKVGSYTGNGTGQAIACGFSAGARFVLIKRTDSTGDWYTFDSARGLTSGSSPYLLLNTGPAEVTGNNGVYASTGGFTFGSTASTTTNINGASYIYLSVA